MSGPLRLTSRQLSHVEYQQLILGPLDGVVQQMERDGVWVSPTRFQELQLAAETVAGDLLAKLNGWAGKELNWNSYLQLQDFLHGDLGLPYSPYYKKGAVPDGKVSTDDRAIEWLSLHHRDYRGQLEWLREYRRALRMAGYAKKWREMARPAAYGLATLHPSFGLASDRDSRPGAITGRFACKNPALNQVPSNEDKDRFGIKTAFVAPPGYVVIGCDASQLEVVLIAHKATTLFGTTILTDKLKQDVDLHILTSKEVHGKILGDRVCADTPVSEYKKNPYTKHKRSEIKNVRYGLHYLKSPVSFGASLFDEAGDAIGEKMGLALVQGLYQVDPELQLLKDWDKWWTKNHGYASSLFGRWIRLDGWNSERTGDFNRAWRRMANWLCQAGGQEILALALIGIASDERLKKMGYRLCLPVHDEIVGICPEVHAKEACAIVQDYIANSVRLLAPLGSSGAIGPCWSK